MKHSTILYLNRFKTLKVLQDNSSLIAFTFLFIISLLSGCLLFSAGKTDLIAKSLFQFTVIERVNDSFLLILLGAFFTDFLFLFLIYIFGTSLIGIAFIPTVVIARGFLFGVLLSNMYLNYGFQAITFNLIIIIPSACLSVLALISGACNSLNLSYCLGKLLLSEGQFDKKPQIKMYIFRFLGLVAITAASTLLQSLMFIAFIKYFNFG